VDKTGLEHLFNKERAFSDVPMAVRILLVIMLVLQLLWHSQQEPVVAKADDLPSPMPARNYVISSLGEPVAMSKVLNLWLQAFDNQPGISIPFRHLDYSRIIKWLDTSLALDPEGRYPMLVAARVYGSVSDKARQRQMMEYIFYKFQENPGLHWRWLAHAVITAKHELRDFDLALKYANALAEVDKDINIPYWARDMKIIVLEDMGDVEAAKILVGALIESGDITDPYELGFLSMKIAELEKKTSKSRHNVEKSTQISR
jgi:hypothetical protein